MKKEAISNKQVRIDLIHKLHQRFKEGEPVTVLIKELTRFSDNTIFHFWQTSGLDDNPYLSLIALGSYGRKELLPYSDIDLLILHPEQLNTNIQGQIETFIQSLWDSGFHVGHLVTSIKNCIELAVSDIKVVSNLMDMRHLRGAIAPFDEVRYATSSHHIWPSQLFFREKWKEQLQRYKKFNETAYNLEPNIKNGPGGLRDLQMVLWVAKRHFGDNTFAECLASGLITEQEYQTLVQCQQFLWRVRFALHCVAGKAEDRILFNYQKQLTALLGFKNESVNDSIEEFMKIYFTIVKSVRELNDLLLQLFRETIFSKHPNIINQLTPKFQITNDYIEVKQIDAFKNAPSMLFTLFQQMMQHPEIKGVRANTIRLLRKYNYLIDEKFRHNKKNTGIFIRLLQSDKNIFATLKRMNRYGLLSRYIPEFRYVIGQMQYDLFHVYTVDQHSLFVVRNIMNFAKGSKQFPFCTELMSEIPKIELLYIAALFHDIGKGRGGCHSTIGANDALKFCKRHQLNNDDTTLVTWLVKKHLLMSHTAQRKDIDETSTIDVFCGEVNSLNYLNHLYLLTVADICATNPTLWNNWKNTLLKTLYKKSADYFNKNTKLDESAIIEQRKNDALKHLSTVKKDDVASLWQDFKKAYFLHERADVIAEQTRAIINAQAYPLVFISPHHSQSGTQVMIYTPHLKQRFSITTTILCNFNLNIVEARILSFRNNYDLDNYVVLDAKHQTLKASKLIEQLKISLQNHLTPPVSYPKPNKKLISRRQKHLPFEAHVSFNEDTVKGRTILFIVASDREGLLANISQVFSVHEIQLHNAKIATTGERVEDTFFITDKDNQPIQDSLQAILTKKLKKILS